MILVIIICGILYLFMIYGVISLYYTHRKDIEEIENRLLQNEKRINETNKNFKTGYIHHDIQIDEINMVLKSEINKSSKEVDNMACKKGRGGRKK